MFKIISLLMLGFCLSIQAHAETEGQTFRSSVQPLSAEMQEKMVNISWKPNCPASRGDLVAITMTYWGFDDQSHEGALVIHKVLADEVVDIFREIYALRFPIKEMAPYEIYGVNEYANHNATVGYYCRPAQDKPSDFSTHSYGLAIDINPMINPFHDKKLGWWPTGSAQYHKRRTGEKGAIDLRGPVFEIFTKHGWVWGGTWQDDLDYMHFEKGIIGTRDRPLNENYFAKELQFGLPLNLQNPMAKPE